MMNIFDINTLNLWRDAFDSFPAKSKEVYFTPEYYLSWQYHEQASPMCFYTEIEGIKLLYPFFIKEIEGFILDNPYYDISTAYGYGGVLASEENISVSIRKKFNKMFDAWCEEKAIVAEFIREMPYVNNKIREANYDIVRNNVYIELYPNYSENNRHVQKNINKAIRNGLRYEWDPNMNNLNTYKKLYTDSFHRIDMDDYYLFPDNYYVKLKELFDGQSGLINVYFNDQIINSMIVFTAYHKMVCHLIGTNYEFIDYRPNDLVYHAAIEISKELGITLISMGGGRTVNDNLFKFKEKFGNCIKDVFVGKKINNSKVYDQLIKQWEEKHPADANNFTNFFLRYRLNPGK